MKQVEELVGETSYRHKYVTAFNEDSVVKPLICFNMWMKVSASRNYLTLFKLMPSGGKVFANIPTYRIRAADVPFR